MNKDQFLDKWIEALPLNSKDQDRKEMSYDLDLLMAKGRSEQLKCQCKKAKFTRTVDDDFNPLCGGCGKAL